MKKFTIFYRQKSDRYGKPIASETVLADTWEEALLRSRKHTDKTWHSIYLGAKLVITLNRVRYGSDIIS
jgi:hypothetical protein